MHGVVAVYVGGGLAACALVLVGWILGRMSGARRRTGRKRLNAVIQRESAGSRRRSSGSVPQAGLARGQLALLEGHLRTAIFDPGARKPNIRGYVTISRSETQDRYFSQSNIQG